jgi:hypothetical protein
MRKKIIGVTVGTPTSAARIERELEPEIKKYIDEQIGDIDTALDSIIEIQNLMMNGVTFTIEYPAAEIQQTFSVAYGTTWGEWVESEDNQNADIVYNDHGNLRGSWTDEPVRNRNGEIQTLSSVILPDAYMIRS